MGTRSLTRVIDKSYTKPEQLVCMYRQFDGYPSGHGDELATFLDGMKIVNGLGIDNPPKIANGAGCLAAQLVASFKDGPGGIYLYPTDTTDAGQDYEYEVIVHGDGKPLTVEVYSPEYGTVDGDYKKTGREKLFAGPVSKFKKFCKKEEVT